MTPREQAVAALLLAAWVETYSLGMEARAKLAARTARFLWLGDLDAEAVPAEASNDLPPTSGEIGVTR